MHGAVLTEQNLTRTHTLMHAWRENKRERGARDRKKTENMKIEKYEKTKLNLNL
jgi:hypothetical protein